MILLLSLTIMASCSRRQAPVEEQTGQPSPAPTMTEEAPMAARVNGEGILLSDYEMELKRYQDGLAQVEKEFDPAEAAKAVLEEMVDLTLLAQGAAQRGFSVSDEDIESRYRELASARGGEDALRLWMAANHYDDASFRRALARDLAAIWMRNQIISAVPETAPQVRARQILVRNPNEATAVERQLQAGTSFETLAFEYDPLTGGDLGWFPRGYLLQPDVENAAFALNPGEFSAIIQTSYGYHIVALIERDDAHPLSPDALFHVRRQALQDWLAEQRLQSALEQYIP